MMSPSVFFTVLLSLSCVRSLEPTKVADMVNDEELAIDIDDGLVEAFDKNGDGVLDKNEVLEMFAALKIARDVEALFDEFDENNDMKLDDDEISKMSSGDSDESDVHIQSAAVELVANYASIYSTGQGIIDLLSSDYGGTIKIKNYLCGGNLIYTKSNYLEKGYFKAHCSTIYGGQHAGCTLSGWINRGTYGMVQYQLKTNDTESHNKVLALNIFFQMSQGLGKFPDISQMKNRVDVFWSDTICDFTERTKRDPSCFRDLVRMRDSKQCWQSWMGSWYYDEECSEKQNDPDAVAIVDGIQAVGRIGGGNNPEVLVEVRVQNDPIGQCGDPSS